MAGIGVAASGRGRRELNYDLALVPFIDFLLCLVAFLLVTAVWSQHARLRADANVPGFPAASPPTTRQELHVSVKDDDFLLEWRQGGTVLATSRAAKTPLVSPDGSLRYPELERAAAAEWQARGARRSPTDTTQERAVLHTPNSLEFRQVTAMLDALHGPSRRFGSAEDSAAIPAFAVAFATD